MNCVFTDICSVDPTNQSYTIAGIQTFQSGILKFEFDNDVSGSWLRILNLPSNSSAFTCLDKICTSRDQNPVDAGTWTVLVTSGDTLWNSIPLISTYYVNDINYCEGEISKILRIQLKLNTALLSTVRPSVRVSVRHRHDISHFSHI